MNHHYKEMLEEYTKININLHNALELLDLLNEEKNQIIKLSQKEITPQVQILMDNNLKSFEVLAQYVNMLKEKANKKI